MFSFGYKKLRKRPYPEPYRIKLVLLGDHGCGKTCLLISICVGPYERDPFIPCVFQSYIADLIVDNVQMEIIPHDICDRNDYDQNPLRGIVYQDSGHRHNRIMFLTRFTIVFKKRRKEMTYRDETFLCRCTHDTNRK